METYFIFYGDDYMIFIYYIVEKTGWKILIL